MSKILRLQGRTIATQRGGTALEIEVQTDAGTFRAASANLKANDVYGLLEQVRQSLQLIVVGQSLDEAMSAVKSFSEDIALPVQLCLRQAFAAYNRKSLISWTAQQLGRQVRIPRLVLPIMRGPVSIKHYLLIQGENEALPSFIAAFKEIQAKILQAQPGKTRFDEAESMIVYQCYDSSEPLDALESAVAPFNAERIRLGVGIAFNPSAYEREAGYEFHVHQQTQGSAVLSDEEFRQTLEVWLQHPEFQLLINPILKHNEAIEALFPQLVEQRQKDGVSGPFVVATGDEKYGNTTHLTAAFIAAGQRIDTSKALYGVDQDDTEDVGLVHFLVGAGCDFLYIMPNTVATSAKINELATIAKWLGK